MESESKKQEIIRSISHQLNCQQNHTVTFLCANPKCSNSSFVCSQETCKCKIFHETCLLVEPQRLTKIIEKKLINSQEILQEVNKIADQCIDWISDWRIQMQGQLKYYGLTQIQKKYILAVHSSTSKNLNGKLMFEILQQVNLQNTIAEVQKVIQSIQLHWNKEKLKFSALFNDIEKMICNSQKCILYVKMLTSKIVQDKEQFKTLRSFFDRQIKGFKLLYRASENGFSMASFYAKCSNIPNTLTLIRTEGNKIIGGFTSLCWKIGKKGDNLADFSKSSFIFSLSNGDKFVLTDPQKAIQYYGEDCGPRFGGTQGASDLTVKNNANSKSQSYALFNNCYQNDKYKKSDPSSYRRFNGQDGSFFKIKQWEVIEVEFW